MPAKSPEDRLDRIEQVVQVITEDQLSLQKLIAELATETRRGFDRVAAQFEETGRRMRESDERLQEQMRRTDEQLQEEQQRTDERSRRLDGLIEKLLLDIRELKRPDHGRA